MSEKQEKASQEIDLIELFSRMGTGISNGVEKLFSFLYGIVSKLFYYSFIIGKASLKFGIRNSPIIIGFGIIGYFYGNHSVQKMDPYYKTNAVVQTFTVGSADLIEYTNNLSDLAGDSVAMSSALNITEAEAASIKSIAAFWLIDKNKDGISDEIDYENEFEPDTVSNWERIANRFHIQLLTEFPDYNIEIQTKYEEYLTSFPRLDLITEVRKSSLMSKIDRIDQEIVILDSLKKYEYFVKGVQQNNEKVIALDKILLQTDNSGNEETRLLHDVTINLQNQALSNKASLSLETEPFIFLRKFSEVNNPVDVNLEYHITERHTATFLFLGLIVALFIRFFKHIIKFVRE